MENYNSLNTHLLWSYQGKKFISLVVRCVKAYFAINNPGYTSESKIRDRDGHDKSRIVFDLTR